MIKDLAVERESFNHVYCIDFGDDYHRTIVVDNELEAKARKMIRRRYKHIHEYLDAKAVYDEYMEHIYSKYLFRDLAKKDISMGVCPYWIPPKPQMKRNSQWRLWKEKGIAYEHKSSPVDLEIVEDILSKAKDKYEELGRPEYKVEKSCDYYDEDLNKLLKGVGYQGQIIPSYHNRNRGPRRKHINGETFNIMNNYYGGPTVSTEPDYLYGNPNKHFPAEPYSITKQIEDDVEYSKIIGTYEDPYRVQEVGGRFLTKGQQRQMEFIDGLAKIGWRPIKVMHALNGGQGRVADIIKEEDKTRKKHEKRLRKAGKQIYKIAGAIDDDYDDYDNYREEMLDVTSDTLFNMINNG